MALEYFIIGCLVLWVIVQKFFIRFYRKRYSQEVSWHARTMKNLAEVITEKESILQQFADLLHKQNWYVIYNDKQILPSCQKGVQKKDSEWPEIIN